MPVKMEWMLMEKQNRVNKRQNHSTAEPMILVLQDTWIIVTNLNCSTTKLKKYGLKDYFLREANTYNHMSLHKIPK